VPVARGSSCRAAPALRHPLPSHGSGQNSNAACQTRTPGVVTWTRRASKLALVQRWSFVALTAGSPGIPTSVSGFVDGRAAGSYPFGIGKTGSPAVRENGNGSGLPSTLVFQ
jgi:hypothetical protein